MLCKAIDCCRIVLLFLSSGNNNRFSNKPWVLLMGASIQKSKSGNCVLPSFSFLVSIFTLVLTFFFLNLSHFNTGQAGTKLVSRSTNMLLFFLFVCLILFYFFLIFIESFYFFLILKSLILTCIILGNACKN